MRSFAPFILALLWASTAHTQPTFTDVTESAGVANSATGETRVGTSLAWGDYDNDADLDLYVTNWASSVSQSLNRLYRNSGTGGFSDVAGSAGVTDGSRNSIDALWGDYDNDGDLDIYVVNFFEQDQLYRNHGNGTFSNVTGAAGVNVISQGDETSAGWGDYDNDGDLDLYLCKFRFRNGLYHNNGDGSFSDIATTAGVADIRDSEAVAWADYDNDGDNDLYVVNREQNNALYKNDGSGGFTEVACALSIDNTDIGRHARWVDYDNDNDLDLFLANIGANALYRNNGNDQFVNVADGEMKTVAGGWISWGSTWSDFNADGNPDLLIANGAESRSEPRAGQVSPLLTNSGSGSFTNATAAAGLSTLGSSAIAAGSADYDNDGDLDFYLVNSRFPAFEASQLFRNDSPNSNTIKIRTKRRNAADGIGAAIRLKLGSEVIGLQLITSLQDALEVVFGVQTGTSYTVETTFSDGTITSQSGVTAGSTVDLQQQ